MRLFQAFRYDLVMLTELSGLLVSTVAVLLNVRGLRTLFV